MRVVAGKYRGRVLRSPAGSRTRPTSDRLRETLFNILAPHITDETRVLDLCAGTGAIGIEALSRGACRATFVDKSRKACALIEQNLDLLGVPEEQSEVFALDAQNFTSRKYTTPWNIIFFDPPYASDYSPVLFDVASDAGILLAGNGIFIAEHHSKTTLPDAVAQLRRWRIVKQGETYLSFYERS